MKFIRLFPLFLLIKYHQIENRKKTFILAVGLFSPCKAGIILSSSLTERAWHSFRK